MNKYILMTVAAGGLMLAAVSLAHMEVKRSEDTPKPVHTVHVKCIANCDLPFFTPPEYPVKAAPKAVPYPYVNWSCGRFTP